MDKSSDFVKFDFSPYYKPPKNIQFTQIKPSGNSTNKHGNV